MKQSLLIPPIKYDPIRSHYFIIETAGYEIPSHLFQNYKIFNEGEDIILTIEFLEMVEFIFNPKNFMDITDVKIKYLDPTGVVVQEITYGIKGSNFEMGNAYKDDGLSTVKFRFIIDKDRILQNGLLTGKSEDETLKTSGSSGIDSNGNWGLNNC